MSNNQNDQYKQHDQDKQHKMTELLEQYDIEVIQDMYRATHKKKTTKKIKRKKTKRTPIIERVKAGLAILLFL